MKKIFFIAALALLVMPIKGMAVSVFDVSYYIRADGIEVDAYYRTAPDGYAYNNLSNFSNSECKDKSLILRNDLYKKLKAGLAKKFEGSVQTGIGPFCETLGALDPAGVNLCITNVTKHNRSLVDYIENYSQEKAWDYFVDQYSICLNTQINANTNTIMNLSCDNDYVKKNGICISPTQDCINTFGQNVNGIKATNETSTCYCNTDYQWNDNKTSCIAILQKPIEPIVQAPVIPEPKIEPVIKPKAVVQNPKPAIQPEVKANTIIQDDKKDAITIQNENTNIQNGAPKIEEPKQAPEIKKEPSKPFYVKVWEFVLKIFGKK